MLDPSLRFLLWAVALGALSAVSLPLGSAVGLLTRPRPILISLLSAFGAGALVAALSVELVAPTVHALHNGAFEGVDLNRNFYALVLGCITGGVIYIWLDRVVNAHGGFLRRTASTVAYFRGRTVKRQKELIQTLSEFPLLQDVPADHIRTLVSMIRPVRYNDGDIFAGRGDNLREIVFITEGNIRFSARGRELGILGQGQVVGLAAVILQIPSIGDGVADGPVAGLALSIENFQRLRNISPKFDQACIDLTEERLNDLEEEISTRHHEATKWIHRAVGSIRTGGEMPSSDQLQQAREDNHGAPLAIWLGILLDGIPESFVIGSGILLALSRFGAGDQVRFFQVIPYTLIAGLFLSNFPEALASSANMRLQGWGRSRILMLWLSLMLITAVGAGAGYLLAGSLSHTVLVYAEGLAAGAMLTMIAAAMIPEAVHQGNSITVGLGTLAGFLAAISFTLLG